jgi:hypothetical protein
VGERLSTRFRLCGRPVGRCVSGPSPFCAIVAIVSGAFTRSRPFAWSEGRRVDEAIRCRQLRPLASRRTSHRRLFSVEDADSSWTFSDLVEPSPNRVDHLTLSWSLADTPESASCRRVAFRDALLADDATKIALRAEGPHFAVPVRARRAKARERLPSYREPVSRNPRAEHARYFLGLALFEHRFAFSPLEPRVRRCFVLPSG